MHVDMIEVYTQYAGGMSALCTTNAMAGNGSHKFYNLMNLCTNALVTCDIQQLVWGG